MMMCDTAVTSPSGLQPEVRTLQSAGVVTYRMRRNRKLLLLSMSFIVSIVTDQETSSIFPCKVGPTSLSFHLIHDVQMKHFSLNGQQCSAFDLRVLN